MATCLSWPTSSGTVVVLGPLETVIVTVEPLVACVPAVGALVGDDALRVSSRRARSWTSTCESGLLERRLRVCPPTSRRTLGTATCLAPLETSRTTSVPSTTCSPAGGSWPMTLPDRLLREDLVLRRLQVDVVQRLHGVPVVHPDHVRAPTSSAVPSRRAASRGRLSGSAFRRSGSGRSPGLSRRLRSAARSTSGSSPACPG